MLKKENYTSRDIVEAAVDATDWTPLLEDAAKRIRIMSELLPRARQLVSDYWGTPYGATNETTVPSWFASVIIEKALIPELSDKSTKWSLPRPKRTGALVPLSEVVKQGWLRCEGPQFNNTTRDAPEIVQELYRSMQKRMYRVFGNAKVPQASVEDLIEDYIIPKLWRAAGENPKLHLFGKVDDKHNTKECWEDDTFEILLKNLDLRAIAYHFELKSADRGVQGNERASLKTCAALMSRLAEAIGD